ncbi:MAG TPA: sugar porter family MFS transporter [Membranihabitans sp.]|nr:sugar porter family MFS transporter [Membranihabitans sp.]
MSSKDEKANRLYLYLVVAIAASGGLMFGFDLGVTSGAVNFWQDTAGWGLSDSTVETITSAMLIGAALGAVFGGKLTDRIGRKKVIIGAALLDGVGSLYTGLAPDPNHLIVGRFLIGLAIGVSSLTVPLYLSEIAPARMRGAVVTMNQLMIAVGTKSSDIIAYLLANDADPFCWRWMLLVGVIPPVILFFGMFFLPETPRWLISKGYEKKGKRVLEKFEDPVLVPTTFQKIKYDISQNIQRASIRELFKPWLRNAVIIAVGIMFFQQATGINTIIFYSPKIFKMAGIDSNTQTLVPTIIVGLVAFCFTLLSIFLIDKIGRRKLFFIGLTGMIVSLLFLGFSFYFESRLDTFAVTATMISMLCYNSFYAISLGPLGWLLLSEIFPNKVRGVGMSIGTISNWVFNALVAYTFLKLVNAFTPAGAFWLYAVVGVLAVIWGYYYIPETKGVTLEEIEEHWAAGKSPRQLGIGSQKLKIKE